MWKREIILCHVMYIANHIGIGIVCPWIPNLAESRHADLMHISKANLLSLKDRPRRALLRVNIDR